MEIDYSSLRIPAGAARGRVRQGFAGDRDSCGRLLGRARDRLEQAELLECNVKSISHLRRGLHPTDYAVEISGQ